MEIMEKFLLFVFFHYSRLSRTYISGLCIPCKTLCYMQVIYGPFDLHIPKESTVSTFSPNCQKKDFKNPRRQKI
jgi:hypothetical protein